MLQSAPFSLTTVGPAGGLSMGYDYSMLLKKIVILAEYRGRPIRFLVVGFFVKTDNYNNKSTDIL